MSVALTFGEVASGLGLRGSTPSGWACPCCQAPDSVSESVPDQTGFCTACGARFDRLGFVMWRCRVDPDTALDLILKIAGEVKR